MTANMAHGTYTHIRLYAQHWKMLIYSLVSEFVTKFHLCDIMMDNKNKMKYEKKTESETFSTIPWAELLHFSRNSYYVRLAVVVLCCDMFFSFALLVESTNVKIQIENMSHQMKNGIVKIHMYKLHSFYIILRNQKSSWKNSDGKNSENRFWYLSDFGYPNSRFLCYCFPNDDKGSRT